MSRSRRAVEREDGAVAIVTAIILTVLIMFAAFVIDLGLLRVDVRSSQSAADAAVTAAGLELDPTEPDAYHAACVAAWTYFLSNIGADPSQPDPCDNYFDTNFLTHSCESRGASTDPVTQNPGDDAPLEVIKPVGRYTFRILMPVRLMDEEYMGSQPHNPDFDGDDPCERIGLVITRDRDHLLAGIGGFDGGSSKINAVSRRVQGGDIKEYATLIVLEPTGCRVVDSGGGSGVVVYDATDPDTGELTPGVITGDTDATTCGNAASDKVFRTGGGGYICAGVQPVGVDEESAAAAIDAAGQCDTAVTDLTEETLRTKATDSSKWTVGTAGSIGPPVVHTSRRVTRQPVDHAYNCRGSYPTFATSPQYPVQDGDEPVIPDCGERHIAAIDELVDAFISGPVIYKDAAGNPINGFSVADCSTPTASGRVIVRCSGTRNLHITDAEIVVVEQFANAGDGIKMSNNDEFVVQPPTDADPDTLDPGALMVIPSGEMSIQGGKLSLDNTFGYLHADGNGTGLRLNGTDDPTGIVGDIFEEKTFIWTAPEQQGWDSDPDQHLALGCDLPNAGPDDPGDKDIPTAECFEDLAMWSNSWQEHTLTGQSNINAEGVFFAPNSGRQNGKYFTLSGGTTAGPGLDLRDAQFFTWRLSTSGQNPVLMRPDPERFVGTPAFGVGLIR